jgi:pimeloyl-ACP methyl ester carboxylesterase/N-formylglutamate amidohydrolase
MSTQPQVRHRVSTTLLSLFILSACRAAVAQESPQAECSLVFVQRGNIPIVLSAPHGGRNKIPGATERKGEGAKKFVVTRDENTAELTEKLAVEIERRLNGKPFLVLARFERKYLDVNRPAEDAFESDAARPHYEAYHQTLDNHCRDIRKRWPNGLLLDIHGQAAEVSKVIRGTNNGETVKRLVERHSRLAVIGPRSLFGALAERGYGVLPPLDTDDREVKFNGGHIVRTYGSHREHGLDAIQIELGSDFRARPRLDQSATDLSIAIHEFCTTYLPDAVRPAEKLAEAVVEDVAFKAECDGSEQRYVQNLPAGFDAGQPHDVLIALHGHGSDRWQFVRDARDECRAARDVATKHGMIYISPDYRARTSWMGPKAEADVVQIIGKLKQKHRVSRVFVCGGSMGGTAALTFAALHPDLVAGVASMNGTANLLEYPNFQGAIAESFGGTKNAIPVEYKKRSAEYWPEQLTMPIAATLGGKDTLVPPHSVRRIASVLKLLGRDVLLLDRTEGGHATNYADATEILEFVIQKAKLAR